MFYELYEMNHALISPYRAAADATRLYFKNPLNPLSHTMYGRSIAAAGEVFERLTRRYGKPSFDLEETEVGGQTVPVRERVVWRRPFCKLVHFQRQLPPGTPRQPNMLIVAPMSGHYATLLRGTVEAMLPDHEVYITDWTDARMVPLATGRFDLDTYIDYLIDQFQFFRGDVHVVAVCQPAVPVFASISLMEANCSPFVPKTMTLMGGPIDPRVNPTVVNELADGRDLDWFRRNVIMKVPFPHPGFMRDVYPGFLQLSGFISMNIDRHVLAHREFFEHLVRGDGDSAEKHREFYDEYLSVMDLTAEFYLQTVNTVFIRHALPKGEMMHHEQRVDPSAITRCALFTIEGEKDDISGVGQTEAAHRLATNLPTGMQKHYVQPEVGHYGVFNGSRYRREIAPRIAAFIRAFDEDTAAEPVGNGAANGHGHGAAETAPAVPAESGAAAADAAPAPAPADEAVEWVAANSNARADVAAAHSAGLDERAAARSDKSESTAPEFTGEGDAIEVSDTPAEAGRGAVPAAALAAEAADLHPEPPTAGDAPATGATRDEGEAIDAAAPGVDAREVDEPSVAEVAVSGDAEPPLVSEAAASAVDQPAASALAEPVVVEPEAGATAEPEALAIAGPDADATAEPDTNTVAEPENNAVAEPETNAVAEPDAVFAAEPEASATTEPEATTAAEPEAGATPRPEATAAAEPVASATAGSEPGVPAEFEASATAEPETRAAAPVAIATAEPKTRTIATSKPRAATTPKPRTIATPKPRATATPKPRTAAKAKPRAPATSVEADKPPKQTKPAATQVPTGTKAKPTRAKAGAPATAPEVAGGDGGASSKPASANTKTAARSRGAGRDSAGKSAPASATGAPVHADAPTRTAASKTPDARTATETHATRAGEPAGKLPVPGRARTSRKGRAGARKLRSRTGPRKNT